MTKTKKSSTDELQEEPPNTKQQTDERANETVHQEKMQKPSLTEILGIFIGVLGIVVPIVKEYWGLFGIGILIAMIVVTGLVVWQRRSSYFPYVLGLLGIGFGVAIGIGISTWRAGNLAMQTPDTGISVPANQLELSGVYVDKSVEKDRDHIKADISLKSKQGNSTYTIPEQTIAFTLPLPGGANGVDHKPLQGVRTTLLITPSSDLNSEELIYCNYRMVYNDKNYISSTQFVPLEQPTTLVWDFTSRPDIDVGALSGEVNASFDIARKAWFQDNDGFVALVRRYSESWQYQYLVLKNYDLGSIQTLSLECNVSATREYRGGNTGDEFNFQGTATLSDFILYPFQMAATK